MTVILAIANNQLKNTTPVPLPTIKHLLALIKSIGTDPLVGRTKKQALQDIWDEVKDNDNWEQTVFFENTDQVKIDELEDLLSP